MKPRLKHKHYRVKALQILLKKRIKMKKIVPLYKTCCIAAITIIVLNQNQVSYSAAESHQVITHWTQTHCHHHQFHIINELNNIL